jgi:hypothetical protein
MTTEQLQAEFSQKIEDLKIEFAEKLKLLNNNQIVEEGKWYVDKQGLPFYITSIKGTYGYGYGFGDNGKWEDYNEKCVFVHITSDFSKHYRPALNVEVEKALITEAQKRGIIIENGLPSFNFKTNELTIGNKSIFNDGRWIELAAEEEMFVNLYSGQGIEAGDICHSLKEAQTIADNESSLGIYKLVKVE